MGKKVIVINGAPGSGKSHYVDEHAKAGDIVFDLDKINAAISPNAGMYQDASSVLAVSLEMRKAFLAAIKEHRGNSNTAYIISASPKGAEIEELGRDLGAEVVMMNVPLSTCIDNIEADERRTDKEDHIRRAAKWYKEHEDNTRQDLLSDRAKEKSVEDITRKDADRLGDDHNPWKEIASKIGGNELPQVLRF